MSHLRQFAESGVAVLAISALSRSRDDNGRSSYNAKNLNMASFRESSELEYGADDAFILAPKKDETTVDVKHVKSRYGDTKDFALRFYRRHQRFESSSWDEEEAEE